MKKYSSKKTSIISFALALVIMLGCIPMCNVNAATEIAQQSKGIDVAKYQGVVDWAAIKEEGVDFAMIRVGYRTENSGTIFEDPYARYNLQQAVKYGIKIGAYFYSSANTVDEAAFEAAWTAKYIAQYPITYPVAFNCEGYKNSNCRQYSLTKDERTAIACSFLDTIASYGYEPMFYAAQKEMEDNTDWNMDILSAKYKVWVAQYPVVSYPTTQTTAYSGTYAMWQYTSKGASQGVIGNVDKNVAYFAYDGTATAKSDRGYVEVSTNPEEGMTFDTVTDIEVVTAKTRTNLRCEPSTDSLNAVVLTLANGQLATRTGISEDGWSRIVYQGMTLYAVSDYIVPVIQ